jgi:uncharacterized protein
MEKLVENKLPEIKRLFTKYNVTRAYLFGSAAANTFKKNSDIDFLYTFADSLDYETYANNFFELSKELENLLENPIDLVAEKCLKNPYLIESINKNKIQLI